LFRPQSFELIRLGLRVGGHLMLFYSGTCGQHSASAVRQSAEVGRSTLSSEQFRSSVFCCRGPKFATWQSSRPSTESQHV